MLIGMDLQVLQSHIGELKLIIPWESLKSSPIKFQLNNVKLVASNLLHISEKAKKDMKQQMDKLKEQALLDFEASL